MTMEKHAGRRELKTPEYDKLFYSKSKYILLAILGDEMYNEHRKGAIV